MTNERGLNAARNIYFGVFLKAYQIIIPFIMRTAMIYIMGVEYLGLNGLFTSILQVLNMAELGVGSAMIFSMYKPIADNDTPTLCALLYLYRKYYTIIGFVIAIVGIIITPFVPKLISSDIPKNINLYVLYLLNLSATVLSYWLFAYRASVFQAYQRSDIISRVTIIVNTIQYIVQLISLWFFHNYYLYVLVSVVSQIVINISIAYMVTKIYPKIKPEGILSERETHEINRKILDLFTTKIGTVFSTSVDNIVISAFLGLSMLAIYQNYYFIMSSVIGVVLVIFNSCTAGIGNSLVVDDIEKNYHDFRIFSYLTMWICVVSVSCFASLYQPFMTQWVGEGLILPNKMVLLMCIYYFLYVVQMLSCLYKDAAGIWHKDRFRPLVAGIVNLILNIVFVKTWGIYAIVLSTIISYVTVAMPWIIHNIFTLVFKRSPIEYIIELFKGAVFSIVSACLCVFICSFIRIDGVGGLIIRFLIAISISNMIVIICRRKNEMFNPTIELINRITKYKFNFILNTIKVKG